MSDTQNIGATDVAPVPAAVAAPASEWTWPPIDIKCDACGQLNPLHEQDPAVLAEIPSNKGVLWECNHCHARNLIPGTGPAEVDTSGDDAVLECAVCHSTVEKSASGIGTDGSWKCKVCDTVNRAVGAAGETSTAADGGNKTEAPA